MRGKLVPGDRDYPEILLHYKGAPKELYYEGNLELLHTTCVAVVGSRKCTTYGRTVAKSIGKKLGENGVTVVSGMARGIDTQSHRGALEVGGNTIAVLGCGIDICYPPESRELHSEIAAKGLIISEYPPGFQPQPYTFPARNRIISGISESVVIVEAGNRSGSLITAEAAAEQGKRLYAVPGNITSHYSFGTNKLIRESVTPLIFLDDILLDLNISPSLKSEFYDKMGKDERLVFNVVKDCGEVTIDQICKETDISPSKIGGIITVLEMKGAVFSSLGKIFVAKF